MSSPTSHVNMSLTSKFKINSKIVRAGAGAGKTTRLTENIYLTAREFYSVNKIWPNLIVTTFTKKATKELRERLVIKACSKDDFEFLEFLNSTNKIYISTIHGVLNLFLRSYGHLMGWDNSFQIMSNTETNKLVKAVIKELDDLPEWETILNSFTYSELISLLSSYVEVKLIHPEATGAGFGNLENFRIQYLRTQQLKIKQLAGFIYESFTHEKWLEYGKKLNSAPCESLSDYLSGIGQRPRKTKEDDEQAILYVKSTLDNVKKSLEKSGLTNKDLMRAESLFSNFEVIADKFLDQLLIRKQKLAKVELKDLELVTLKIIREEPSLAQAFSREWDYWLIDEYQDTSPLQEFLLSSLIGERPVYIVGDPQQSIYLFRGARSEVFAKKEAQLCEFKETLVKNYRSRPEVLSFINDMFSGFEQKFLSMEYGEKFGPAEQDYCAAEFYEGEEEGFVATRILELLEQGHSPEKICILSRKNKSLLAMARALSQYQIPTHVHASSGFYSRREVLDIVFLVRFLANPHDNENFIGLLRTPWIGIRDEVLIDLAKGWKPSKESLWSFCLQQKPNFLAKFVEIVDLSETHGVFYATESFLLFSGVVDYSHYQDSTGRKESNIWKFLVNWQEQEKKPGFNIFSFLNQSELDLSDSDGASESDAVAALEPNSVNLMTIHASKGLQFDYVFVIDCGSSPLKRGGATEDQRLHYIESENCWGFAIPNEEGSGREKTLVDHLYIEEMQKRELEESDRLFYVALTRTIQKVFLSWKGSLAKDSWLARSHFTVQPGIHQRKSYSYKMTQDKFEGYKKWRGSKREIEVIGDLSQKVALSPVYFDKISVTQFLENQQKNISKPKEFENNNISASQQIFKMSQKAKLGTDFHKLFESYRYNPNLDVEKFLMNNFDHKNVPDLFKAFEWVLALKEPPMRELLRTGHVEWGFQRLVDDFIVEGQIDLWGEIQGVTWLVDYKSGSTQYKDRAVKQLDLYAEALGEIGKKHIRKVIIYPLEPTVFFI